MNYRTMTVAIVGIICITGITCFNLFVKWQTGAERCEISVKMQHDLLTMACKETTRATIEETFVNMNKELCSTWDAEVELKKLEIQ